MSNKTSANPHILAMNVGSSSIKFALFEVGDSYRRMLHGGIEAIGSPQAVLQVKCLKEADNYSLPLAASSHTGAVDAFMDWVEAQNTLGPLAAVGHRVVHGGPKYCEPVQITSQVIEKLHRLSPFDPEHLPAEILLIEAFRDRFPHVTPKQFSEMVNSQSGLLGVSETSSDMRDLLQQESNDVRAAEAVSLFCYQIKRWIGSFAAGRRPGQSLWRDASSQSARNHGEERRGICP